MTDQIEGVDEQLPLDSAGSRLRRAREDAKMSIEHVAAETRIPQRHIQSIEDGKFSKLPSRTYAIGFSRSYARLVGLDDREIIQQVREDLARESGEDYAAPEKYEPGDPARVPSRGLAWFAAFAAILLLVGGFSFYRSYFAPGIGPAPLSDPAAQRQADAGQGNPAATAPTAAPARAGQVVFTALEEGTWVRFYDGSEDNILLEKLMAKGERYAIPADAADPQIRTGRPDAFSISIGGKAVAKLAEDDFVMSDVPVTAEALLAREPVAAAGAEQST